MSAFALLHGKTAFPAEVASGRGWPGSQRARSGHPAWWPQLALNGMAGAGGPGEEVTSGRARPGRHLLGLLHKGRPRSPH